MNRSLKRALICAAIVLGSVLATLALSRIRIFELVNLKAQDTNFVLRGKVPTKDIVLIGIDNDTLNKFSEPSIFWHKYYADAMKGAAEGGAKVFVLDVTFGIPVVKWEKDNDQLIAEALATTSASMPVVAAYVPEAMGAQQKVDFIVPFNIMAAAMGAAAYANLTSDTDDFVRRQELIEAPKADGPTDGLARSMALRTVEKYLGKDAVFRQGRLFVGDRPIPVDADRALTINFAGPPATFPMIPLWKFIEAVRANNTQQITSWVKDKIVLLGPDNYADRYSTPFYTFHSGLKANTPGYEIHANTIRTMLTGSYLQPVPQWARIAALFVTAGACIAVVTLLAVTHTTLGALLLLILLLGGSHLAFRYGWLFAAAEILTAFSLALLGGVIYRFATAEKKSSFFKSAVALFVSRDVASSLEESEKINLTGERQLVTILFTDIRGFTAFCESKDPAVVVDLLNIYMSAMVSIIVKYGGHVNKFIGDGILAVFSDNDPGAKPGDHAVRTTKCATEMVSQVVGEFRTGAGFHSGEVVIGNVGSSDKLEYTVLGNTVNLASRLESLNKDQHTRLLMSEEAHEMLRGEVDTVYLGAVPVKGKTEKMKLFTVTSLLDEARLAELREQVHQ